VIGREGFTTLDQFNWRERNEVSSVEERKNSIGSGSTKDLFSAFLLLLYRLAMAGSSSSKSGLTLNVPRGDLIRSLSPAPVLHSQVIKIREEEQHVGNNMIGEGKITPRDRMAIWHLTSQMKDAFVGTNSRPAIPSPLGIKERAQALSVNR